MSRQDIERGTASLRRNQNVWAFSLQLVPPVRLFAPALAALLVENSRGFLTASAAGIALWNGIFIGIGYYASHAIQPANNTVLALAVLGCVLTAEAAMFWIARQMREASRASACG